MKQVGHLSQGDIPLSGTGVLIEQQLMSVGVIAFDVSVCKSPVEGYALFLTQMIGFISITLLCDKNATNLPGKLSQ